MSPDGVIHYPSQLARAGVTVRLDRVQGRRAAGGGCTSTGGDAGAQPGQSGTVVLVEEASLDPKTCASVTATATLSRAQAALVAAASQPANAVSAPGDGVATSAATSPDVTPRSPLYSRYLRTAWVDPINIEISSQQVGLRWYDTGWSSWGFQRNSFKGCIGSVCLDKTYIVSGSNALSGISNGWQESAQVHFRNTSFALWVIAVLGPTGWAACGFPTSNQADFYHSDTVRGLRDGSWSDSYSDSKSGACTNLVHHATYRGTSF